MRFPARAAAAAALLAALLGVAACAPRTTDATHSGAEIGRPANVSFGTIVSMRPVVMQAENTGAGNDVRGSILGALGGGGVADSQAGQGQAVEFIIREDTAPTPLSVVQTNTLGLQPGERVVITRGARTFLARGAPPALPGS